MKITIDNTNSTIQQVGNINTLKLLNIPLNSKKLDITDNNYNNFHLLYELHAYINLVHLKIKSYSFNQIIDHTYNNLKYLYIDSSKFNQDLDYLPNSLIVLSIKSFDFNAYLNNLPITLKKLIINSDKFNQELDLLPESLRQLHVVSNIFNKKLDDLPSNLKILQLITREFNKKINCLPSKLQKLIINTNKNIVIEKIPDSLHTIIIYNYNYHNQYDIPNLKVINSSYKKFFKFNKIQIILYYRKSHESVFSACCGNNFITNLCNNNDKVDTENLNILSTYVKDNIKIEKFDVKYVGYKKIYKYNNERYIYFYHYFLNSPQYIGNIKSILFFILYLYFLLFVVYDSDDTKK